MPARRLLLLLLLADAAPAIAQGQCEHPITDLSVCPPCPASTPLCRKPVEGYQPTINGCGPEKFSSLIENGVIPQGYGAADFRNGGCPSSQSCGCNEHDRCYGTCNSDKTACDNAFRDQLMRECARAYPVDPRGGAGCSDGLCFSDNNRLGVCRGRARLYYRLVASTGQSAYDVSQKEACQCCCNTTGALQIGVPPEPPRQTSLARQVGPVCLPPTISGTLRRSTVIDSPEAMTHLEGTVQGTVQFHMDPEGSSPGNVVFLPSGTCSMETSGTSGGCTTSATSVACALVTDRSALSLEIETSGNQTVIHYSGTVGAMVTLRNTLTCPSGTTTYETQSIESLFLVTPDEGLVVEDSTSLRGTKTQTVSVPSTTTTWTWDLTLENLNGP